MDIVKTLHGTLSELLTSEAHYQEMPPLLTEQADLLQNLVSSGAIREYSACIRLRVVYKELMRQCKDYHLAITMDFYTPRATNTLSYDDCWKESGCKGVTWSRHTKKWKVFILIKGSATFIGSFRKLEEAVATKHAADLTISVVTKLDNIG